MTETNEHLKDLISNKFSMREICLLMNISQKQFYVRLKQLIRDGYVINPNYVDNGEIFYSLDRKFKNNKETKINVHGKEFRFLVISDIHIGNKEADIDLLKKVYEYAVNNNINIILNCGDLIEGDYTSDSKIIKDTMGQVEYLIKKYPYDRTINNFTIFGNHDFHSLYYDKIDISKIISRARYDIIPLGYGKGFVNLKSDKMMLSHELSLKEEEPLMLPKICLVGHGHMMKTKLYERLYICVPSLSYVSPDKTKEVVPGFIDMRLSFDGKNIDYVELKHMIVDSKIIQASESRCRLNEFKFKNKQYVKTKKK